jgi:hypothetical protein
MPEKFFGEKAGKVWETLSKKGPMTAPGVARTAKLDITDAYGALGWLGREGKIKIAEEKGKVKFALAE